MLTALYRICVDFKETQQRTCRGTHQFREGFSVLHNAGFRGVEGAKDADGNTRGAAWGVDGEIRRITQSLDAFASLVPTAQPSAP